MPRPYMALRQLMLAMDWDQEAVGRIVARNGKARSGSYISMRLRGQQYFDTFEAYAILKAANLPESAITIYFPKNIMERVDMPSV